MPPGYTPEKLNEIREDLRIGLKLLLRRDVPLGGASVPASPRRMSAAAYLERCVDRVEKRHWNHTAGLRRSQPWHARPYTSLTPRERRRRRTLSTPNP